MLTRDKKVLTLLYGQVIAIERENCEMRIHANRLQAGWHNGYLLTILKS